MKNWDDLRYYLTVARSGTVSAAARQMAVSHSTVLRRIDALEAELGVKLFQRLQSGYRLTEAGSSLYKKVAGLNADVQFIEASVRGQDEALGGVVRVTQTENVVVNLYPIYEQFCKQYPGIKLEVLISPENVNLNQLEADVAIRQTEEPGELLVGRRVGSVQFSAFAASRYLARFDTPPSLAELDWVLWDKSVSNWGINDSCFHQLYQLVAQPKVVMETANYSEILAAIKAGLGAGFLSHEIVEQSAELVAIADSPITAQTSLWVLTHRDLRNVTRIKCFMNFVANGLSELLERH
jgi:DNA-binding transcriptional LysR family regulator